MLSEANKYFEKALQIYPEFAEAHYDHSDVFSHSLLSATGVKALAHLSERQQYERLMSDLKKALELSQTPGKKTGYAFTRDFFSTNWSGLPSYTKEHENWDAGWEAFLALTDAEFVIRHYLKKLDNDPFSDFDRYCAALGFANGGKLDSGLLLYNGQYGTSLFAIWAESTLHFRKKDYAKALEKVKDQKNLSGYQLALEVLSGTYSKGRAELDRAVAIEPPFDPYGYSSLILYNALGEYAKADSIASQIDSRLLGHCIIGYNVLNFGLHFHLSATPNFAARLRELGINTDDFEKNRYARLPVAKLGI
jgi:tetratricopeptide (TPR) repeat protein